MSSPSSIRRQPHIAETVDYLRRCGADDIDVVRIPPDHNDGGFHA